MNTDLNKNWVQQFLAHQRFWVLILLLGWFAINVLVLATTQIMEFERAGKSISPWMPFSWELSSALMILLLIPVAVQIYDRWISHCTYKVQLIIHLLLTLPFSIAHVVGMVGIRQFCYFLMDSHYDFGNIPVEFFYEYRKDAQSYLNIALAIFGYRFIVRRLQGEASYLDESGPEVTSDLKPISSRESSQSPERLLIKKLGREFLIQVSSIEWVEASGNYANLHIKDSVYPMRITMDKLENLLPSNFIRIHRSIIVDIGQVSEVLPQDTGDFQVTLTSGKTLPLSRRYREAFKAKLS